MTIVSPRDISTIEELNIEQKVMLPFSKILIEFINDISKSILKDYHFKRYPELMSLAFWMRKSHLLKLKEYFLQMQKEKILLGRGTVFHIAPSNVDTIFIYSWFLSLLVGNSNIIRISDKENIQTELLINIITSVLAQDKYKIFESRTAIIRYAHEDSITKQLSLMADVRVIWGGDKTIKHIRTIPLPPTATELTFADKFSFAIINSKHLLKEEGLEKFIKDFYNDTFWFGQMACSSMRSIAWIGSQQENENAKKIFWKALNNYTLEQVPQDITATDIVNKLVAECSIAIESSVNIEINTNPYINRVHIEDLSKINADLHCGAGLFYEFEAENIEIILKNVTKKHQTIAHYGFSKEELAQIIYKTLPKGIDRIVPVGRSLEFSHIWDGYDLFQSFCREVEIWN